MTRCAGAREAGAAVSGRDVIALAEAEIERMLFGELVCWTCACASTVWDCLPAARRERSGQMVCGLAPGGCLNGETVVCGAGNVARPWPERALLSGAGGSSGLPAWPVTWSVAGRRAGRGSSRSAETVPIVDFDRDAATMTTTEMTSRSRWMVSFRTSARGCARRDPAVMEPISDPTREDEHAPCLDIVIVGAEDTEKRTHVKLIWVGSVECSAGVQRRCVTTERRSRGPQG